MIDARTNDDDDDDDGRHGHHGHYPQYITTTASEQMDVRTAVVSPSPVPVFVRCTALICTYLCHEVSHVFAAASPQSDVSMDTLNDSVLFSPFREFNAAEILSKSYQIVFVNAAER